MDSEASALEALRHALERTSKAAKESFTNRLDSLYSTVLASPGTILVSVRHHQCRLCSTRHGIPRANR